jgi:serine/threonine-protein kinase
MRWFWPVEGDGTAGYSGDNGPATSAQLNSPSGVAVDAAGNVYVADSANDRIRVLVPSASIRAVANAASNVTGAISPGEIVAFYGSGLGPRNS